MANLFKEFIYEILLRTTLESSSKFIAELPYDFTIQKKTSLYELLIEYVVICVKLEGAQSDHYLLNTRNEKMERQYSNALKLAEPKKKQKIKKKKTKKQVCDIQKAKNEVESTELESKESCETSESKEELEMIKNSKRQNLNFQKDVIFNDIYEAMLKKFSPDSVNLKPELVEKIKTIQSDIITHAMKTKIQKYVFN